METRSRDAVRAGVWTASVVVLVASAATSFRLDPVDGLSTALLANLPRVLLGAAAGALLATSGRLRLATTGVPDLGELQILGFSTGGALGAFLLGGGSGDAFAWLRVVAGALAGGGALFLLVRALDRPRRWTNLAAAPALLGMIALALVVGTYARERPGPAATAVAWLLGDLGHASPAAGLVLLAIAIAVASAGSRALRDGATARVGTLSAVALGLGFGAAGPLAFVGTFVPRAVRTLAGDAPAHRLVGTSAAAGAATVVAIDAVPRLLLGGYAFPWNAAAGLLAVPVFLGWNRARLLREAGRAGRFFEVVEVALLGALTLAGVVVAAGFVRIIRSLT